MSNKTFVLILAMIIMLLIVLGRSNERNALTEHRLYCEMVELWHANKQLPPEQRPGWPPYKGECDE